MSKGESVLALLASHGPPAPAGSSVAHMSQRGVSREAEPDDSAARIGEASREVRPFSAHLGVGSTAELARKSFKITVQSARSASGSVHVAPLAGDPGTAGEKRRTPRAG